MRSLLWSRQCAHCYDHVNVFTDHVNALTVMITSVCSLLSSMHSPHCYNHVNAITDYVNASLCSLFTSLCSHGYPHRPVGRCAAHREDSLFGHREDFPREDSLITAAAGRTCGSDHRKQDPITDGVLTAVHRILARHRRRRRRHRLRRRRRRHG
jgi:hypothetical protein